MGLDVHRISEFKLRLHPNEKLRAWYLSHTFGGTTKARSLKILGFSKRNFYWVLAGLLVLAAAGGGLAVYIIRGRIDSAKVVGESRGLLGQIAVTQTTQTRARTYVSAGQTILTTEIATFQTSFQRGAKTTRVVQTGADGAKTTLPANVVIATNSLGEKESVTKVGNTLLKTSGDVVEETTVFGVPSTFTSDGSVLATTAFEGVTVVTGQDGQEATSFVETTATTEGSGVSATNDGRSGTSPSPTPAAPGTPITSNTLSNTTPSATSTQAATTSASGDGNTGAGGGGGGEEFEGEATFYAPGLGSCGTEATDNDFVAALSKELFDSTGVANSNNNPYCGRKAFVQVGNALLRRHLINSTSYPLHRREQLRLEKESRRRQVQVHNSLEYGFLPSRAGGQNSLITPAPDPGIRARQVGGGGVTVTIVDRCPVCKRYDLDLSPAAYNALGDPDDGRILIKWSWLD